MTGAGEVPAIVTWVPQVRAGARKDRAPGSGQGQTDFTFLAAKASRAPSTARISSFFMVGDLTPGSSV